MLVADIIIQFKGLKDIHGTAKADTVNIREDVVDFCQTKES